MRPTHTSTHTPPQVDDLGAPVTREGHERGRERERDIEIEIEREYTHTLKYIHTSPG